MMTRWLAGVLLVAGLRVAVAQHDMGSMSSMGSMDPHMKMTPIKPKQAGDQARAAAIEAGARTAAAKYTDYRKALADGYEIFMPDQTQGVYHFVSAATAMGTFDPAKPPALLYKKAGAHGYTLVGVMYMARHGATEAELNERVPLSVGQWHEHLNMCVPGDPEGRQWLLGDKKFGLDGSIVTREGCAAAGGRFLPHLSGWMVHVYTSEKDPKKVWAAGMDDDHLGMGHDAMPGMKM